MAVTLAPGGYGTMGSYTLAVSVPLLMTDDLMRPGRRDEMITDEAGQGGVMTDEAQAGAA